MKVYPHNITAGGSGSIKMDPKIPEDFWHVYNLLEIGDMVQSKTIRKVLASKGGGSGSLGASKQKTVTVVVKIEVEGIDFDSDSCVIRLNGRNRLENKHVQLGKYHTLELAANRAFTLEKKKWDQMHLDRIEVASNPAKTADLAVVVMEHGLAHIILITEHMTITKAKIEKNIPKKRVGSQSRHSKAITRFYKLLADHIAKDIDFEVVKCVVLASPAFVASDFKNFLYQDAQLHEVKAILDNKSKFILGHTSSGQRQALKEVLADNDVMSKIGDTKCAKDMAALNKFYKLLSSCPERAFYGKKHILKAIELGAIETFMITDELFRCSNHVERTEYVNMVEKVREFGSKVLIFSAKHPSGDQLRKITGIAAILRFPIHDEVSDEESSESSDDSEVEE